MHLSKFTWKSHSQTVNVTLDVIAPIQVCMKNYRTMFRKHFRIKVILKQHILDAHCIPWIDKYGFGLAFHSEQGGELIHASVAELEGRGAAIRIIESQLHIILKSQCLQTSSELLAHIPPIKKHKTKWTIRKRKNDNNYSLRYINLQA